MLPMLIHVGHDDKKTLPVIAANAVVLGSAAGVLAHYSGYYTASASSVA